MVISSRGQEARAYLPAPLVIKKEVGDTRRAVSRDNRGGCMRLAGKVALISGGASGMGQSEASLFAKEGASVVVGDILEAEGQRVVADIAAAGGKAQFVKLDVTREADWQQAIKATVTGFGTLNVLVNNAGISGS